jgi:hypothetical protein
MIEITEKEIRDEMRGGPSGNFPVPADPETAAFTAETRASSLAPAGGTATSVAVPDNSQALIIPQAPIVPLSTRSAFTFLGVKPDLKDMTLDEKFACLKQAVAYGQAMTGIAIKIFESIIAEFKTYKKNRPADCPTVEMAFRQRGLNYGSVRVVISRYRQRNKKGEELFDPARQLSQQDPTGNDTAHKSRKAGRKDNNRLNRKAGRQAVTGIPFQSHEKEPVATVTSKLATHSAPNDDGARYDKAVRELEELGHFGITSWHEFEIEHALEVRNIEATAKNVAAILRHPRISEMEQRMMAAGWDLLWTIIDELRAEAAVGNECGTVEL